MNELNFEWNNHVYDFFLLRHCFLSTQRRILFNMSASSVFIKPALIYTVFVQMKCGIINKTQRFLTTEFFYMFSQLKARNKSCSVPSSKGLEWHTRAALPLYMIIISHLRIASNHCIYINKLKVLLLVCICLPVRNSDVSKFRSEGSQNKTVVNFLFLLGHSSLKTCFGNTGKKTC